MNLAWGFPLWSEDDPDSVLKHESLTARGREMLAPPGGARQNALAREVMARRQRL